MCAWDARCAQRREADDHLSLVARIRRDQIKKLEAVQIPTLAALAAATSEQRPLSIAESTFETLRRQARLQHQQNTAIARNDADGSPKHFYELLAFKEQQGFALLPKPAAGDIFFDMEGDPLYQPGRGLEYLFGVYAPDDQPAFRGFWAHSPSEEKHAFEQFIDYVMERRRAFPDMHIYHYAPYEKIALRRLMSLHNTREAEIDELLRAETFVDLYAVVRQALCISQPSYSIKKLEAFYEMTRQTETKFGGDSIVMYEQWIQDPTRDDILLDIERYNQDDCLSTSMLRDWLLKLRAEAVALHGPIEWHQKEPPPKPCHDEPDPQCKGCEKRRSETRTLNARQESIHALLSGLEEIDALAITQQPESERERWMLAHLLEYHRREQKPVWWAFYDRCENQDTLIHGDNESLGGLRLCSEIAPFKLNAGDRNFVYTYAFPEQQYKLQGAVYDPATRKAAGDLVGIDSESNRLHIKRSAALQAAAPLSALIPGRPIATDAQDSSLERIAHVLIDGSLAAKHPVISDILLRRTPRLRDSDGTIQPEEVGVESLVHLVQSLDSSYLFIQGPPGSGKSTKAAAVIAQLLKAGSRVGVLANSHQAIHSLLHKVEEAAQSYGIRFRGLQKSTTGATESQFVSRLLDPMIESTGGNTAFTTSEWNLAAGTSWLFAREEMTQTLDYLFIDEAGQIALADTIAVAPSARNVILLGDPLQLAQVSQGIHPDGIGASALEHLLGDEATVPPDRGVFLNKSYRMHPSICEFISHNVYDDRLTSAPATAQQQVECKGPLAGAGLRYIPVEHTGNAQESAEEARRIAEEIEMLLLGTWTDARGLTRLLTPDDVLVVTPYNAQRRRIQQEFKTRSLEVRVGTVDKFQGQEAAVVFFSMATSTSEDLPRNIEFLFNKNRFNVAVSRARCLAILVSSPRLLDLHCTTIEQMALTNLLCSFIETASQQALDRESTTEQLALF
ncbi:MAG: TM0106 family RecB-like putative nuclease [Candidatus Eremiobacteraeota bacterium]|nr:TM0106 family RecB-like putative nuclease [Candidatus Eremiobacteraeota bacterium]